MSRRTVVLLLAVPLLALGATPKRAADRAAAITAVAADRLALAISAVEIKKHITYLADDALEGRGTRTRGYDMAAKYVADQFAALGLAPAGANGSYLQPVPFLALKVDEGASFLALERGGHTDTLRRAEDYLMRGDWLRDKWTVDGAPLAFVGFGVSAPELGYDDYAGIDVRGKVVVMMRGAPKTFDHNQRALYSWNMTKEAAAAGHGAAGIITFRTPSDEARAPWERAVRQGRMLEMRWTDEQGRPHDVKPQIEVDAGLSRGGAAKFFEGARIPLSEIFAMADSGHSRSFDLAPRLHARRVTAQSRVTSPNVIGILRGTDPVLRNQAVVVSAHLDHLGISSPVNGDSINNGAYDNASGIASMLELARVTSGKPQKRTLVFLAVTGEEKGLQGADYFAQAPTIAEDIVANVNLDMFLMTHPFVESIVFGAEHSTLGPVAERAAAKVGVKVVPDPVPEEVVFVRSDQFPFVRRGIPAVFPVGGGGTPEWSAIDEKWERTIYHSPQDDLGQNIDWEAGAKFTRFATYLTLDVANGPKPAWNAGDYFGTRFVKK